MKNIAHKFTIVLLLIDAVFCQKAQAQSFDNIANAIKNGNSAELAANFVGNVEITIKSNSGSYSKSQAEMVLKSFFSDNKPNGFSISHQGNSPEGSRYFIGNLTTSSGTFRTYVYAKATGNTLVIQEIRFEDK